MLIRGKAQKEQGEIIIKTNRTLGNLDLSGLQKGFYHGLDHLVKVNNHFLACKVNSAW